MSLFIIFESGRDREFHVQDFDALVGGVKQKYLIHGSATGVMWIQANGHELEYITSKFKGLPSSSGPVVRWYGDHAKFIIGNI